MGGPFRCSAEMVSRGQMLGNTYLGDRADELTFKDKFKILEIGMMDPNLL